MRPVTPDDRLPDVDPWILDLEPAVTAFVNLSAPWEGRRRTTTAATIDAIADGLSSWCRLAGATTIAHRGSSTFVIDHRDAARELRASPALEHMYGLWQILDAPRRARLVDFTFQAKAVLQVVDETSTAAERLPDLLAGLRVVAPYVDYAWVRRATPLIPSERDMRRAQAHRHGGAGDRPPCHARTHGVRRGRLRRAGAHHATPRACRVARLLRDREPRRRSSSRRGARSGAMAGRRSCPPRTSSNALVASSVPHCSPPRSSTPSPAGTRKARSEESS